MQRSSLAQSALAAALVSIGAASAALSQNTVDVPAPNLPTIQSGIDSLPNGGTVRLAVQAYAEHLLIDGKMIVLESADPANHKRPIIKADDPSAAVVTYANGGGGSLRYVDLKGGAFGIVAGGNESEQCMSAATTLSLESVRILKAGRGIYGSFAGLDLLDTEVSRARARGISLVECGALTFNRVSIHDTAGIGLLLFNYTAPIGSSARTIQNSEFLKNAGGGIEIRGGALPLNIAVTNVIGNRDFGIRLVGAHNTTITNSALSLTGPVPGSDLRGDGLNVFRSMPVKLEASSLAFNSRVGVSAYGCAGSESQVEIKDDTFNNKADLWIGKIAGCATPQSISIFLDSLGNTCSAGPCVVAPSEGVDPIPPPEPK